MNHAMTTLVPAICTQCRGRLEVDSELDAAVCPYCRTPYIVSKAIDDYTIEQTSIAHADTVVQDAENVHIHQSGVSSVVGFVERQMKRRQDKEDAEAREAAERAEQERRALAALSPFQRVMKKYGAMIGLGVVMVVLMAILGIMAAVSSRPDENGFMAMPAASSAYEGQEYHGVVEQLRERGFTNVEARPLGDLIVGWLAKPDEVDRVTVAGNPGYSTSKRFPPNVEIVVYFHSYPEDEGAPSAAPSETPAAAPSSLPTADAVSSLPQQVRARFLEAWGVDSEGDLLDYYLKDPVAPTYAIVGWDDAGGWVRVHVQVEMTDAEVQQVGKQILGLTCDRFPSLRGIVVRGLDGIDVNVPRSAMPLCMS